MDAVTPHACIHAVDCMSWRWLGQLVCSHLLPSSHFVLVLPCSLVFHQLPNRGGGTAIAMSYMGGREGATMSYMGATMSSGGGVTHTHRKSRGSISSWNTFPSILTLQDKTRWLPVSITTYTATSYWQSWGSLWSLWAVASW